MKIKIFIAFLLLNFSLSELHANSSSSLIILGDSISAGYGMSKEKQWSELLKDDLRDHGLKLNIINASASGETTGGGLARVLDLLKINKPNYILIELGGNDALRGYPPKEVKKNLIGIIKIAQSFNATVILMQIRIPPNYGTRYKKEFESIYLDVAESTNSLYMPFMLNPIALKKDLMMADGIHPKAEAQALIAKEVFKNLQELLNL